MAMRVQNAQESAKRPCESAVRIEHVLVSSACLRRRKDQSIVPEMKPAMNFGGAACRVGTRAQADTVVAFCRREIGVPAIRPNCLERGEDGGALCQAMVDGSEHRIMIRFKVREASNGGVDSDEVSEFCLGRHEDPVCRL